MASSIDPEISKNSADHVEHCKEPCEVAALPDPEAEKRLVRKLDRTILPWIMLLYLLSYLDRYVKTYSFPLHTVNN